jgi:hypothetical protein
MERAAQAVALVPPERKIRAAVRAVTVEQAPSALCILEQHQVLAQQPHRLDRPMQHAWIQSGIEFIHQRQRLPIAAKHGAAWRAGADARDQFVLVAFHGLRRRGNLQKSVITARRGRFILWP